jgi:hypothetical protein
MKFNISVETSSEDEIDLIHIIGDRIAESFKEDYSIKDIAEKEWREKLSARIDKKLDALITEEFFNKCCQKTNGYGEPIGKSITLVELMLEHAKEFMNQKVDKNGSSDRYDSDKTLTRLQYQMKTYVESQVSCLVKIEADKLVGESKETAKQIIADLIDKKINK